MTSVCNVFISHIHEDDPELGALKGLLAKHGCEVRDSSIDKSKPNDAKDPDYIKSAILGPRIEWAGTVVVLISPGTHESEWVNWEIERAQQLDKRIVGVWAQGAKDSDLPENLDHYADAIVGWSGDRVIDAITGKKDEWISSSGVERPPREIRRYSCH